MNKRTLALAPLMPAILFSTSSPASAEGTRFACDTPNGRISEIRFPIQAKAFAVRGTIKPALFRRDDRWLPTAAISLQNPSNGNSLAINMIAQSGEATDASVTVKSIIDGDERTSSVGTLGLDKIVGFEIVYRQDSQSQITIGEQTFTASPQLASAFTLSISCSTADVVFDNIVWQVSE